MHLEEISFVNFRNLENTKLKFKPGVVSFFGDNAQGKTNLLEAIALLSTAKSFRTRSDHELITWGETQARVKGRADHLAIELTVRANGKKLTVNKQSKKAVELFGNLTTVIFTPADVEIVSGSPQQRRRFLDHLGSNLARDYLLALVGLSKVIRSRNQTLFLSREGRKTDLWVWDQQLAKLASQVWLKRTELAGKVNSELKTLGKKLLSAHLKLDYHNPLEDVSKTTERQKIILKALERLRGEEIRKSQTLFGPQRDDFQIILEVTEKDKVISKDLGIYGSRGEQRSATLALKLAEVEIISKEKEEKPLLLLDEVLSELDEGHRKLLLASVKNEQIFITTTNIEAVTDFFGKRLQKFQINSGKVKLVE